MTMPPFDPSWLGDLSPLLILGICLDHAVDDGRHDNKPYDELWPVSEHRYPLGAGLPRTIADTHPAQPKEALQ